MSPPKRKRPMPRGGAAYRMGIHSNIPECCVRFYVANEKRICAINARRGSLYDGVQYVMCTSCLRRFRSGKLTPNSLHICRDSLDHPLCHEYLSGPDRAAGLPLRSRYVLKDRAPVPFEAVA